MQRERLPKGSLDVIELLEQKGALTQKQIIDSLKEAGVQYLRACTLVLLSTNQF